MLTSATLTAPGTSGVLVLLLWVPRKKGALIPAKLPTARDSQKAAQYKAFTEEKLKVKELVTTEMLCKSSLIAKFQNIDSVKL
uniref:Uncharacterized protein n=1 Tax=Cannabis sativa TaxID=3483 RepID=A0A803QGQ9_CANSA